MRKWANLCDGCLGREEHRLKVEIFSQHGDPVDQSDECHGTWADHCLLPRVLFRSHQKKICSNSGTLLFGCQIKEHDSSSFIVRKWTAKFCATAISIVATEQTFCLSYSEFFFDNSSFSRQKSSLSFCPKGIALLEKMEQSFELIT